VLVMQLLFNYKLVALKQWRMTTVLLQLLVCNYCTALLYENFLSVQIDAKCLSLSLSLSLSRVNVISIIVSCVGIL